MRNYTLITLTLSVLAAGAANAGSEGRILTFDQLRTACSNPESFQNQLAPRNLEISCHDVQYRYIPHTSQNVQLDVNRIVTSSIASDKYTVNPSSESFVSTQDFAACPQFKKVKEELSVSRALTCDEVMAYKGAATEFCMDLLNDLRQSNPSSVVTSDTLEIYSACAATPERGQRGQRAQRGQRSDTESKVEDDRGQRGQRPESKVEDDRGQRGQRPESKVQDDRGQRGQRPESKTEEDRGQRGQRSDTKETKIEEDRGQRGQRDELDRGQTGEQDDQ